MPLKLDLLAPPSGAQSALLDRNNAEARQGKWMLEVERAMLAHAPAADEPELSSTRLLERPTIGHQVSPGRRALPIPALPAVLQEELVERTQDSVSREPANFESKRTAIESQKNVVHVAKVDGDERGMASADLSPLPPSSLPLPSQPSSQVVTSQGTGLAERASLFEPGISQPSDVSGKMASRQDERMLDGLGDPPAMVFAALAAIPATRGDGGSCLEIEGRPSPELAPALQANAGQAATEWMRSDMAPATSSLTGAGSELSPALNGLMAAGVTASTRPAEPVSRISLNDVGMPAASPALEKAARIVSALRSPSAPASLKLQAPLQLAGTPDAQMVAPVMSAEEEVGNPSSAKQSEGRRFERTMFHLTEDADGLHAWIRDASLRDDQEQAMAAALLANATDLATPLAAVTVNGKLIATASPRDKSWQQKFEEGMLQGDAEPAQLQDDNKVRGVD